MERKFNSLKLALTVTKEFIKALGKSHTYNIRKNPYLIFGILWGIPVPIVTLGMGLSYRSAELSLANAAGELIASPIHFFFLIHPILFGVIFGAMGTIRDDKEKQRLEFESSLIKANQELKTKNKRLEELDELKDSFLSMVSHELLSPLTTVQGYVSFIRQGNTGKINQQQSEMLEVIEEQTDYLNNIIEDLLDISRIETGKLKVQLECLGVENLISKVVDSFQQQAQTKEIALNCQLSSIASYILADEKRITQVFTNILSNALKFTPSGGRITFESRENNNNVEFSLADTGIGIPVAERSKIFDKFYQVDSTSQREYEGCGLGLAITKSIVKLHGGRIWVESKLGQGSKFSFEIQKCKPEQNQLKEVSDGV